MKESIIIIVSTLYIFGVVCCGVIGVCKMLVGANLGSDSDYFKEGCISFFLCLVFPVAIFLIIRARLKSVKETEEIIKKLSGISKYK